MQAGSEIPASRVTGFARAEGAPPEPADWPSPWADWFARISPAPVLWSYHELGADLLGPVRSSDRSDFFKKLIGELQLPKGSSVFWPSAMPLAAKDGGELAADAVIFSAGIRRLKPQVVVVFGERALEDIGLSGSIRPFRQELIEGKLVLGLPEIAALLRNSGQRASAVSLLRAVLSSVRL
ncbi:MAG: hypothetical protein LIP28_09935 [Deltaproteobacteria bacterium]|nr:hypothetical protein [Deltaproteobacteria bacterium]